MSCTPTSHILDRSLSPSDESRFVPHSSIVASTSVMETHFPTTPTARRMTDDDSVDDKHKHKEPTLIEEENGIVGATICFTPQPSPDGSPRVETRMTEGPPDEEYIGELKLGSSIMRVASSLDNRSITEYEMLDEIQSRAGSLRVEDLDLSEEADEVVASAIGNIGNEEEEEEDVAFEELLHSPPESLPSLTPYRRSNAAKDPPEMPVLSNDGLFGNLEYSDEATAFSRMTKSMLSRMSKAGKLDVANVEVDGSASNASSSPKVDDTPLLTLKNLRAFWESRVLGNGKEAEENEKTKNDPKPTLNQSVQQKLDASNSFGANSQHSNTSSQASSYRQEVASFLSVIGVFVSIWAQRLALGCAFGLKKILEQIYRVLVRSIVSMTASKIELLSSYKQNVTLDEPTMDEVLESSRVNLSAHFSEDGALDERKSDETQSKTFTVGWKSIGATALSVLVIALFLLVRFFPAKSTLVSHELLHHVCLTTNTTSFDSIPVWEVNLAPTENVHLEMPVRPVLPRLALIASIVLASVVAVFFHLDLVKISIKKRSKHLTGIWSSQEHEQFLDGYGRHGANWKLVASFIPTRNYRQVKTHANHWIKVGSPEAMKRSRKMTFDTTPKSTKSVVSEGKMTPNTTPKPTKSCASTQTTPKLSNITTNLFGEAINEPAPKRCAKQLFSAQENGERLGLDLKIRSAKRPSQAKQSSSRYSL